MTTGSPRRGRARAALVGVAALLCLVFIALGSWQVERRAWKLALIERVEARVHAAPVAAPDVSRWPRVNAADDEYRHVRLLGRWLPVDTLVQAVTERGAGFWVLTPLEQADGSRVLVNRGFVESGAAPAQAPAGPVTLDGLLRLSEPGGGFLRRNDPAAERWYSRDVAAIATARRLDRVAPYFVDADASSDASAAPGQPIGGLTVIAFRNSHLVYAITWYTLALMSLWAAWSVTRVEPNRADD